MKYEIYQICITELEYKAIDGMDNPMLNAKYYAKRYHHDDLDQTSRDFQLGLYTKVAEIEANDLEHVFHISNCPGNREELEPLITRFDQMHSVSVNDVVKDGNGQFHVVAAIGFEYLEGVK